MRKVAETGTKYVDWRPVQHLLWEEHNGPIPKGLILRFKDGNPKNITLDNLELITKSENMRRNSYRYNYPKEIQQVITLRGALNRAIKRKEKANEK